MRCTNGSDVCAVNCRVHDWAESRIDRITRRDLRDLVRWLVADQAAAIAAIMRQFGDRTVYPERPMVLVGGRGNGSDDPTVWLLGWRAGDWTPIHDHHDSEAAISVLAGEVTETIYWPDDEDVFATRGSTVRASRVSRELHSGSVITVPTPYVHKVGNPDQPVTAVSMHAYYPPLRGMRYFEEHSEELRFVDEWME